MKPIIKAASALLWIVLLTSSTYAFKASAGDFYQLKVYHIKSDSQEKIVDDYLRLAYLPAAHRAGISKVGVFKPRKASQDDRLIYVWVPFSSFKAIAKLENAIAKDQQYLADGKEYLDASYKSKPYERIETILLDAFPGSQHYTLPKLTGPKAERVYELRSYEGPTEKIHQNKVEMFNKGDEIGLFKRLNFNAVFYAEVIAGSRMPNLMYMTTFESVADRDAHWKSFGEDSYWKKLSAMPEYQNNVSKSDSLLLYPTDYSDI